LRADRCLVAGGALLLVLGCRQQMADQPRCEPLGASRLFADGKCAREPVRGTVARGTARDPLANIDPKSDRIPLPLSPELIARGRTRYDVFCSPCHDRVGTGRGMIVQRGYTAPPSLHEDRLRNAPAGHFVDVMTRGWGAMPGYAAQVPVADRWAIAAYVRALQRSQHASVADVPPDQRPGLDRPGATP
jgi:mono/diheme cytochrome c family protein